MPVRPDEPLRKVTMYFYEADCMWLEKHYGHGWTARIRQHIQTLVHERRRQDRPFTVRIIGDLSEQ